MAQTWIPASLERFRWTNDKTLALLRASAGDFGWWRWEGKLSWQWKSTFSNRKYIFKLLAKDLVSGFVRMREMCLCDRSCSVRARGKGPIWSYVGWTWIDLDCRKWFLSFDVCVDSNSSSLAVGWGGWILVSSWFSPQSSWHPERSCLERQRGSWGVSQFSNLKSISTSHFPGSPGMRFLAANPSPQCILLRRDSCGCMPLPLVYQMFIPKFNQIHYLKQTAAIFLLKLGTHIP